VEKIFSCFRFFYEEGCSEMDKEKEEKGEKN